MGNFQAFNSFVDKLGKGVFILNTDTLKIYLSNVAPSSTTHTVKADIAEITGEHDYTAGGHILTKTWTTTGGIGTLTGADIDWVASGGTFGPFRYAILYDDTAASDPLIGWKDCDSIITVADGGTFTIEFPLGITLTIS